MSTGFREHDPQEELDLLASARLLGLGRKRLIRWAKADLIPHRRDGFAWFFNRDNLLHFATLHCLECGKDVMQIDEGVYFCKHCASGHCPERYSQSLMLLESMKTQRIQLSIMRLEAASSDEVTAIATLQERFELTALEAYQYWYMHHHQKRGTIRLGLGGDVVFDDEI
jgi:hypothetical protein